MKKWIMILVSLLIILAMPIAAYANEIRVTINGAAINFDGQPPVIIDGRTLVPVRGVFEALGFDVSWNQQTRAATLQSSDHTVIIIVDSAAFTTNGVFTTLDVPAQIINGRTMLPIRAVVESVGHSVGWDGATSTVTITTATAGNSAARGRQVAEDFLSQYTSIFSHGRLESGVFVHMNTGDPVSGAPLVQLVTGNPTNWRHGTAYDNAGNVIANVPFLIDGLVATRFYLYDFDGNGIPEILILYQAWTYGTHVLYQYQNGAYRQVANLGFPRFLRDASGQIIIEEGDHEFSRFLRMDFAPGGGIETTVVTDWVSYFEPPEGMSAWPGGATTEIQPLTTMQNEITNSVNRRLGLTN